MAVLHRSSVNVLMALSALVGSVAPALASGLPATPNLLSNGSFETTYVGSGGYCYLAGSIASCGNPNQLTDWTGSAVVIASDSGPWGTPSSLPGYSYGNQLVGLQNERYVEQALTLAAGAYDLSWSDAGRNNFGSGTSYEVRFNNNVLQTFDTSFGQAWTHHSLTFTSTGSGPLRFAGLAVNDDGTAFIDNLVLTAHVPEPQSLALVALALGGLVFSTRRRTQR